MMLLADARMDSLYALLPELECKGLCWKECHTGVGCSNSERARIARKGTALRQQPDGACSMLKDGRCTVYAERPMICRLWGIDETMPCPHGCVPKGGHMPEREAIKFLRTALAIGGGSYDVPKT